MFHEAFLRNVEMNVFTAPQGVEVDFVKLKVKV